MPDPKPVPPPTGPYKFEFSGKYTRVLLPLDEKAERTIKEHLEPSFELLEHPPITETRCPIGQLNEHNTVYVALLVAKRQKVTSATYGVVPTLAVLGPFHCKDYKVVNQYGITTVDVPKFVDAVQGQVESNAVVRLSADKDPRATLMFLTKT